MVAPEPFPDAHFATFPTEIPRRCIRLGTPAHGVCATCGTPYVRMTEEKKRPRGDSFGVKDVGDHDHGQAGSGYQEKYEVRTVGWKPLCGGCDYIGSVRAAIVLDPFLGAGTTALVALKAGRDFVGIELNPAYVEMAEKRIAPWRQRLL